eukprot:jgi/Astpho2/3595/gw1.00058.76.1_t
MAVSGLLGWFDPFTVTAAMILYIVADFIWIAWQPQCLPSLPSVILCHHAITLVLLVFPLRHPDFAYWTCVDALVELNTALLIARRQFPQFWNLLNCVYWATFFPVRFALSPYLVFKFWSILEDAAWYDRWSVTLAQMGLCGFNCLMLWASVKRRLNP